MIKKGHAPGMMVINMKKCKLVKVVISNSNCEFYFKVIGIGYTKVFNERYEAEKFIKERGYEYDYSVEL